MKAIFIALTFLGYGQPFQQRPIADPLPPPLEYYLSSKDSSPRYAFFRFNKKRDHNIFDSSYKSSSISKVELKVIEKIIADRADIYNKTTKGSSIKQPRKYYKQLIAVINSRGEKEVWVNCCCTVIKGYWKTNIAYVDDGGSCYFNLKINLTQRKILHFGVNGEA